MNGHKVEASETTTNCITVKWKIIKGWNIKNFEVKYRKSGEEFWGSITDKVQVGIQSYDVCNLNTNTQYTICVQLLNAEGQSMTNASCVRTETADKLSNTYIRSSIGAVACVIFIMAAIVLVRYCTYKRQQLKLLKNRRNSRSSSAHGSFRERSSTMGSGRSPRHSPRLGHTIQIVDCDQCDLSCAECKLNAVAEIETRRASLAVAYPGYLHPSLGQPDLSPMLKRYHSLQVKRPEERPRPGRGRSSTNPAVHVEPVPSPGISRSSKRLGPEARPRRMSRAQEIGAVVFPPPKKLGQKTRNSLASKSQENVSRRRGSGSQLDVLAPLPRRSASSFREQRHLDVHDIPRRSAGSYHEKRCGESKYNCSLPNGEIEIIEPLTAEVHEAAPVNGDIEMSLLTPQPPPSRPEEIHFADSEDEDDKRHLTSAM